MCLHNLVHIHNVHYTLHIIHNTPTHTHTFMILHACIHTRMHTYTYTHTYIHHVYDCMCFLWISHPYYYIYMYIQLAYLIYNYIWYMYTYVLSVMPWSDGYDGTEAARGSHAQSHLSEICGATTASLQRQEIWHPTMGSSEASWCTWVCLKIVYP